MLPTVYRRDDARWIVLPSVLREAPSLRDEGSLQRVGCANIEFGRLTDALALAIALHGFGLAQARDKVRLQDAMDTRDVSASRARI